MEVVRTSLEALIQRATNPQNRDYDIPAIKAFSTMVTKENQEVIGSKLLAVQIHSDNQWQALQALLLLEMCMKRCGPLFHAEVGKFRFLNEMIKLVSPKYLGKKTPTRVQDRVLELLYDWTKDYPKEVKIKEAFEMLKKQGVVREDRYPYPSPDKTSASKNSVFEDEEKSKILQRLLQSKNPHDLQAANRLIRAMVREDEQRVMAVSNRTMQLKSVHNNVKLLSDMLDSFSFEESSTDDFELITEIYEACEHLKPTMIQMANEVNHNEEMMSEILAANDALVQVLEKYSKIVALNESKNQQQKSSAMNGPSLLDFSNPAEVTSFEASVTRNESNVTDSMSDNQTVTSNTNSDMDVLQDIFKSIGHINSSSVPDSPLLMDNIDIMQPAAVSTPTNTDTVNTSQPIDSKTKALEELNELSDILLKETLSSASINGFSDKSKNEARKPMNHVTKTINPYQPMEKSIDNFTLCDTSKWSAMDKWAKEKSYNDLKTHLEQLKCNNQSNCNTNNNTTYSEESKSNKSSLSISWLSEKSTDPTAQTQTIQSENVKIDDQPNCSVQHVSINENSKCEDNDDPLILIGNDTEIKSLADIHVTLENIQPGTIHPLTVIEEKNGITVVLHFAADSPRPDVSVIVVTTMSKNKKPLSNYLFQAVVPKRCKCRLQPPSGTELPAHNPFLPPSAITQIMLIANPHKEPLSLKFMLSYLMDDETITEMGEVDQLPVV